MSLELIPNGDLTFKGPFNTVSMTTLKLSNSGNDRLAYKIKTTAPKRYCVKPNSGFLDAHATTSVQVMLQPQTAGTDDDRTKHKFMVQWVEVPNDYVEDVDNFWKQDLLKSSVHDSKLKCVFSDEQPVVVAPNELHGPKDSDTGFTSIIASANVTEARNQQQSNKTELTTTTNITQRPVLNVARDTNITQSQYPDRQQDSGGDSSILRLKTELENLTQENKSLTYQLKQQDLRCRTTSSDRVDNPVVDRFKGHEKQKDPTLFGVALTNQLLLVALVAAIVLGFSLGYFLFSCGN